MIVAGATPARTLTAAPPAFFRSALPPMTASRTAVLHWLLRLATAGAFIGHGAYGAIMEKPGWYPFFDQLGIGREVVQAHALMLWVGGFEMLLGAVALLAPIRALLLALFVWKTATEFVWYPQAGLPAWEFVERWSNYTVPLALILVRGWPRTLRGWFE